MKEKVIAVFDIGKTNKKLLLFNDKLSVISETEEKFSEIKDEDGFECDDLDRIERWIKDSLKQLAHSEEFELIAVNFTTYGATLVYLDSNGRRLTPAYNYLKPMEEGIADNLYNKYGGKEEFCRRTASPALGMLNSGLQILRLKYIKPAVYAKVRNILHLPQYLSYTLTGKINAEHTSIGCHTAMWDYDKMSYHQWIADECIPLPEPVHVSTSYEIELERKKIRVGIGIHDSSASLAPYFTSENKNFILISTGTWCINMNPFNKEKLTAEQLSHDCLCYMSVNMEPVMSSRLFLGHLHSTAVGIMSKYYKIQEDSFKFIKPDIKLFKKLSSKFKTRKVFFREGESAVKLKEEPELFEFDNFVEGYHQLLIELCDLTVESIERVIDERSPVDTIYITGGFSKNDIFLRLLASSYPHMQVFTTEVSNASALGAALVISDSKPILNLGLIECKN